MKKIIWSLLILLGIVVAISGCARWPYEPGPGTGTKYQLQITVQVLGEININDGMYYIILDNNGNSADGPGEEVDGWNDDYYYVKLDGMGFSFAQVKDDFESIFDGGSFSGDKVQVTIALSDLEDPNSIDINVITADSDNNTYDHLDGYFTISTYWGFSKTINDSEGDSGDGGVDFDIVKVTAEITTLY